MSENLEAGTPGKAPSIERDPREAEMEAMMEAGRPGEAHARLARLAGSWTVKTRAWMSPGAPPVDSVGSTEARMILGDRFLEERITGGMPGMPYEGLFLTGYDNLAGRHNFCWIDNMGTLMVAGDGDWDSATDSLVLRSEFVDPMTRRPTELRMVTRVLSPSRHVIEMFIKRSGEAETKAMEMDCTKN